MKVYSGDDFDADGLDFAFELENGLNPFLNDRIHPEGDFDLDGFKNEVEWHYGTSHLNNYAGENAILQVDTRIEGLESAPSFRFSPPKITVTSSMFVILLFGAVTWIALLRLAHGIVPKVNIAQELLSVRNICFLLRTINWAWEQAFVL